MPECRVLAQICDAEGLKNLEEILDNCHGAVIARGQLGLEIGPEKVALAQNFILSKTAIRGKVQLPTAALQTFVQRCTVPLAFHVSAS